MDLIAQILTQSYTKTQALRALAECKDKEEILAKAKKEILAIEPLHLFVAQNLPDGELEKIVGKLRKSYGPKFLVEIKFQGDLIGGCAMSYKGVYKDYSIKNRLKLAMTNGQIWK